MSRRRRPMPEPAVPRWAVENGMPRPKKGERFDAYWRNQGVPDDVLEDALHGLTANTADLANQRMSTYLRRTTPRAFEMHLARRLSVVRRTDRVDVD